LDDGCDEFYMQQTVISEQFTKNFRFEQPSKTFDHGRDGIKSLFKACFCTLTSPLFKFTIRSIQ
jgi:hypothetical protein